MHSYANIMYRKCYSIVYNNIKRKITFIIKLHQFAKLLCKIHFELTFIKPTNREHRQIVSVSKFCL